VLLFAVSIKAQCTVTYPVTTSTFGGVLRDIWPCVDQSTCGTEINTGTPLPICLTNETYWQCGIDFQRAIANDYGIIYAYLDTSNGIRRPALNPAVSIPTNTISSPAQFQNWYVDVPTFNIPFTADLVASNADTCNSLVFEYDNQNFYPIDGMGFGNFYNDHNYGFTYSLHLTFTYQGDETFNFAGDDDVWVFINGILAIDIGGVHSTESAGINLSWPPTGCASYASQITNPPQSCATPLSTSSVPCACIVGLNGPGNVYTFDLFYNERHTVASDLQFTTSLLLGCAFYDFCGVCGGNGQSCCNCSLTNMGPCYTCTCNPVNGQHIYTEKSCPAAPNACTNSFCDNNNGTCVITPLVCNDNNNCTVDSCSLDVGCEYQTLDCDNRNPCDTNGCSIATGCYHIPIPDCVPCTDTVVCPVSNNCTYYVCDPNTQGCNQYNVTCNDNNLCTTDGCDPHNGCYFNPITCNDHNPCTIDTCNGATGCVFTPVNCKTPNLCLEGQCDKATGNCSYYSVGLKPGDRCQSSYCDPNVGIVPVTTQCPQACSHCDSIYGCQNCPNGFGTVAQVATGIGAGIIAAIIIGAVAFIIIGAVGGKKGYDAYMKYKDNMTSAHSNPLYTDSGRTGTNALYEG